MHVKHDSITMPMKKNISRISFIVHQKQIFNVFDNLICGISGGQDSFLLVLILYHLKNLYNLEFNLIYCNHFWHIKNFYIVLQLLKISYLINSPININVPTNQLNSEEDAHLWRKKIFSQTLHYCQANRLLLGHTLNDQIETALWHFLRGTSPKGLLALKSTSCFRVYHVSNSVINLTPRQEKNSRPKILLKNTICKKAKKSIFWPKQIILNPEDLNINFKIGQDDFLNKSRSSLLNTKKNKYYLYDSKKINQQVQQIRRPLLNLSRSAITKIIKNQKLPIINDNTNQSKKLMRNKIRLILLPLFHYYIHIISENQIKKYINISEKEQKYLDQLNKNLMSYYCNYPEFIKSLRSLPIGIQRLCIRKLLEKYTLKQLKLKHIELIESLF
jgi:tRNA(Ile)-lysidine synthase TilS/MesJ